MDRDRESLENQKTRRACLIRDTCRIEFQLPTESVGLSISESTCPNGAWASHLPLEKAARLWSSVIGRRWSEGGVASNIISSSLGWAKSLLWSLLWSKICCTFVKLSYTIFSLLVHMSIGSIVPLYCSNLRHGRSSMIEFKLVFPQLFTILLRKLWRQKFQFGLSIGLPKSKSYYRYSSNDHRDRRSI